MSMHLQALTHMGGLNSIDSFARSWQRAVGFHEITPTRANFAVAEDDNPHIRRLTDAERTPTEPRSLIRQQIEREGRPPESAVHDATQDNGHLSPHAVSPGHIIGTPSKDIFSHASHLASPFSSSFGAGTYGSLSARTPDSGREMAAHLFVEQQATGTQEPDKDMEPMLLKRYEDEDGKVSVEVVGQSTIYQTILNSTNVLIGVGLLSLPLGIKYAGWIIGIFFLTASAITTAYTARLLAKCLDVDRNLITFSDISYAAFGRRGQIVISVIFILELLAACVALFVLFADSLYLLVEGWSVLQFKILCGIVMIPLSFVPLRLLGYTSTLGIICCLTSKLVSFRKYNVLLIKKSSPL